MIKKIFCVVLLAAIFSMNAMHYVLDTIVIREAVDIDRVQVMDDIRNPQPPFDPAIRIGVMNAAGALAIIVPEIRREVQRFMLCTIL